MTPEDYIHKQVYQGAVKSGVDEKIAESQADNCLNIYKKGLYSGKVVNLIDEHIKIAKRRDR